MRRRNRLARLFRALSEMSQKDFGDRTGVHPVLLAQYELGQVEPSVEHLDRLARGAGLTVEAGERVLRLADTLRQPRQRAGLGAADLLQEQLASLASGVYQRLLRMPVLPETAPRPEDRDAAGELWALLEGLTGDQQLAVVRVAPEFQTWALVERLCEESVEQASRGLERAASLARLAQEVADRVQGEEGWRSRVRGYAAAHGANVLRVTGELEAAEVALSESQRLWAAGSDPQGLLDPGRLLDLEGSLRRAQRRFQEALALFDQAVAVSRTPERALLKRGFTLEVMGESERAIETLLQAKPLVERRGDPRLLYMLRFNLAVNYSHVRRFDEAAQLLCQVRDVATERGDENEVVRVVWLEGRIAAGLGRQEEARALLAQARREFATRKMWYDVALALLEEAVLLLEEGKAPEVKILAQELAKVFQSKGVQREALAALRLFRKAAEREVATAEQGRRLVKYLCRARHDPELRYEV